MLEKGVGGRDMMFLSGRGPEKLFWCGGDLFSRGLMNTFPTGCQTGPGSSPAVFHFGAIHTWSNLCRLDHATKTFLQAQNIALFGSGLGLGRNFFSCWISGRKIRHVLPDIVGYSQIIRQYLVDAGYSGNPCFNP